MSRDKASELFARMQDAALEDLLRTSDQDILKEAAEDGRDLKGVAAALRERIAAQMAQARRERLIRARKQLDAPKDSHSVPRPRPPFQQLKRLVIDTLRATPAAGVAFREGQRQTEADWESMYDDLVDLGAIQPRDDGH